MLPILALAGFLGASTLVPGCASEPDGASAPCSTHSVATACCPSPTDAAARLREKWGIEIASTRLSAQGYFVDFRYKVSDPVKAAPLARSETKPYLIDQATGKRLRVPTTPKLGPLRQTAVELLPGRTYFIFFGNSSGLVRPGSLVTVVVGDCRLENLSIQ